MNTFSLSREEISDIQQALASGTLKKIRPRRHQVRSVKDVFFLILKVIGAAHLFYIGWIAFMCFIYLWATPGATAFMAYRSSQNLGKSKPAVIRPIRFIPFRDIPRRVRNAFIKLEDHEFYEHWGISPGAMREAMERNMAYRQMKYGGSTISQQTAKNLFLYPDRTLFRKYLEIIATLVMEGILPKDRILELYLNTIEFGPGVFGLGAAARYHYGTSFHNLSLDQSFRLAVIITSPLRYTPETYYKNLGMVERYQALQ